MPEGKDKKDKEPEEDLEEYSASFAGAKFHEVHALAVGLSEQLDSKV